MQAHQIKIGQKVYLHNGIVPQVYYVSGIKTNAFRVFGSERLTIYLNRSPNKPTYHRDTIRAFPSQIQILSDK